MLLEYLISFKLGRYSETCSSECSILLAFHISVLSLKTYERSIPWTFASQLGDRELFRIKNAIFLNTATQCLICFDNTNVLRMVLFTSFKGDI